MVWMLVTSDSSQSISHIGCCLSLLSIAYLNIVTKSSLGRKGLSRLTDPESQSTEGSPGLTEVGTAVEPLKNAAQWLAQAASPGLVHPQSAETSHINY